MSTISGIGSGTGAARAMPDMSAMRQRMFSKLDSDSSGGIDETELQQMLSKISAQSGQDLGKASDQMTRWDSDGSGSLSSDELDTGMKSLLAPPSSTVEFAQRRGGPPMEDSFAKVDTDGNGSVGESELQTLLDRVSQRSGQDLGQASDLMSQWDGDGNGNGNLSSDELDQGMEASRPTTSTLDFAQGSGAQGTRGMDGMPPPPPAAGGSGSDATSTSSGSSPSSSTDAADTNGDGVVTAGERAAAELDKLLQALAAATDTNDDKWLGSDATSSFLTRMQQSVDAMA